MMSTLLINDVKNLTFRQLQIELKSRNLKAIGRREVLCERLRQAIINDLDECSICLDKLSFDRRTTVTTNCLHRYHRICLRKWVKTNENSSRFCPLCRTSLVEDEKVERRRKVKQNVSNSSVN